MLDEPTAGVDPISRRSLWELLQMIRRSGRTIFMTTQSMEECDALCTRVAILVRGQIVCLGSPNHLKHKYGQGYTIILYATIDENGVVTTLDHAIDFIKRTIESAEVFNQMEAYVHIQIQDTHIPMSQLFGILQQAQDDHGFASYRVQQSTLEQVFLMLMKQNDRLRGRPTRSRINLL
ncbi:unnamed protein product [Lymnaea stagnalis]|uniref:Uncharacterized protein n=1 Tax=Lymnaea stagnalis TaxID=6523 RepID=A0AAV2IKG0_LYMST